VPLRTLVGEAVGHGRAWLYLTRRRGRAQNFGDAVNPVILNELTGESVTWAPLRRADVVCIGSVLNAYVAQGASAQVIGSGVRTPTSGDWSAIPRSRIIGVRGVATAKTLGISPRLAIGDPGLVISQIVSRGAPNSSPLFVPHFTTPATREGRRMISAFAAAGFRVSLPNEEPESIARAISSASFVVTSSLHALVFADAYGTPCARLLDPGSAEPDFKYADYRSVFDARMASIAPKDALARRFDHLATEEQREAVRAGLDCAVERIYRASAAL
jgi:pyruvyltransferase